MAKKPSGYGVGNVRYGRFSGVNPRRAANENRTVRERVNQLKSLTAETDRMLKADKSYKLNSGKAAYGPKPPSMASKIAGTVGRGLLRGAGPAGALIGMTTPAGVGSDRPPKGIKGMTQLEQAAANAATSAKRPTSSGLNAPARTKPSGSARPTSSNLSAPARTSPSSAKTTASSSSGGMRSGPGSTGGSKTSSPSSGSMRSGSSGGMRSGPGSTGGSKTSSSSKSSSSGSTGPSRGPTSSPSRTSPSKSNLGTSRF